MESSSRVGISDREESEVGEHALTMLTRLVLWWHGYRTFSYSDGGRVHVYTIYKRGGKFYENGFSAELI